jgi:hypothetical protein
MKEINLSTVDQGFIDPPVGKNTFKIVSVTKVQPKDEAKDPFLSARLEKGGVVYTKSFFTWADGVQGEIANQHIGQIAVAVGLTGKFGARQLPELSGKYVTLDFQPANDPKYINLKSVEPASVKPDSPSPASEESENSPEEDEAPAAKKKQPWEA